MIKLVFCCHRKPELTREEFQRYWLDQHAVLVKAVREQFPQMRRYVQSHTLPDDSDHDAMAEEVGDAVRNTRPVGEPFDGITEIWLDESLSGPATEDMLKAHRRLLEDELRFIDFSRSTVFHTREYEIFNEG